MPYLTEAEKTALADPKSEPVTAGQLTYLLTSVLIDIETMQIGTLQREKLYKGFDKAIKRYKGHRELRYADYAAIMGSLANTLHEYARRRDFRFADTIREYMRKFYIVHVAPYEDMKIEENGDCFPTY